MRFTITPLGSAGGRSVAHVVDEIVRYLDGPPPPATRPAGQPHPTGTGASTYYTDGNAEAGRWMGNGAVEMGLSSAVDCRDFAPVLAGRDPHTGVRLITAQGSAGRKPTLARGTQTRWDADGEPLYDIQDAAAALKLQPDEVQGLITAGESIAFRSLTALLGAAAPPATTQFEGAYLVPTVGHDGTRWLAERELQRCEAARAVGPDPDALAASGKADDILPLSEAARLAGVGARYLRSLCKKWERDRERIVEARAADKEPRRPFLIAYRGTKRQWLVKRADLVDYLRHRSAPAVRVAFDLTLTTEKSLGVLALLGDRRARTAVLAAIQAGNDRGLAHLEYTAAMARARGEPVSTRGWTVASFRHLTSRALDPFPHHHNVVANTVVDPDGERRALDARWLYRHAGEASALATVEMRYRLSVELGVRWRRGRKGGWEIDGIPDAVLREFSRRSNEVDDAVAELEALIGRTSTIAELRGLVTKTRPAKRRVDAADLMADWWHRAQALRFAPRHLARCVHALDAVPSPPNSDQVFAVLAAPDGLCKATSIFGRADVIAALADMAVTDRSGRQGPLLAPADEVERRATEFLASDYVVELLPAEGRSIATLGDQPVFTTVEMLAVQTRTLARFRDGRAAGAAVVPKATLARALSTHGHLTSEQQDLVAAFCSSGHRAQCAIGRAGAGKTTAMRAAVSAWTAAGYRVQGAAVKGEAARHLGDEAGISSETIAWHLAHTDPATSPLDSRTVLIVDEASTVSDRDLDRLLWLSEATGATVRLIGDPSQHGAVGAGGMFRVLCEDNENDTPELRASHRVANAQDRSAADALRDGRVREALELLDAAGHLHVVGDEVDLYLELLERWWNARCSGNEHPMVDRRNHTRWQLNRLAHRLLQVTGEVAADETVASGDRRFSVGDRVVARSGERSLHPPGRPAAYVRNGATGTVLALDTHPNPEDDTIRVTFDGLGEIDLPRAFFDDPHGTGHRARVGLDHAYAVTSYGVQGATFAESTSRIDENASRSETYVDITRGRTANYLYLTRGADPLDGEHLPKAPRPPIAASVSARLAASGPERAAIDVDPGAPLAEQARRDRNLAQLRADAFVTGGSAPCIAHELRSRQAARIGPGFLDPSVLMQLPPRSHLPYLARQWDQTVAHLSAYLLRWNVRPGGTGRWEWALGPKGQTPGLADERRRMAQEIADLTVATVKEAAREAGYDLPDWAGVHLAYQAALGTCVHSLQDLRSLYDRIDCYRHEASVMSPEEAKDAEETIFGGPTDDAVLRANAELSSTRPCAVQSARRVAPRTEPARDEAAVRIRHVQHCAWLVARVNARSTAI